MVQATLETLEGWVVPTPECGKDGPQGYKEALCIFTVPEGVVCHCPVVADVHSKDTESPRSG